MIKLLRQSLLTLSLFSFLLLPVVQAYGAWSASAFCGNGQAQSALALKMQQVASAELLAHLGLSQSQEDHCPQCVVGSFAALTGSTFELQLERFTQSAARLLRSLAARSVPNHFKARAPPSFSL